MQENNILLRFLAVPRWQKIVAAGIALAVGSGVFIWTRRGAATTPAVLSFDAGAAQQYGLTITGPKGPAVAFARMILGDEVVRGLAEQAKSAPADFRTRLEMTQPSAQELQVRYRDADHTLSAEAANAVADVLVRWTPLSTVTAAAPAVPAPQTAVKAKQAVAPRRRPRSDVLRKLEAQLSAVNRKLAAVQDSVQPKADASAAPPPPGADDEQRHALESQLSAAQKKLAELRVRYTDEYPDVESVKDTIAEIQQKLASMQPVKHEAKVIVKPPDKAAIETAELRAERARLVGAVAAEKQHENTLLDQAALPKDSSAAEPAASPLPAQPQPQPVPKPAGPGLIQRSPFTLLRIAGRSEVKPLGMGAFAGLLCGVLCLAGAIRMNRAIAVATDEEPLPDNVSVVETLAVNTTSAIEVETSDAEDHWEKDIREAMAFTDIGREDEVLAIRDEVFAVRQEALLSNDAWLQQQADCGEVLQVVRDNIKKNPNSWMAHTEGARTALARGDFDTAVREIKQAITIAPEKVKPQLSKIALQLNKSADVNL